MKKIDSHRWSLDEEYRHNLLLNELTHKDLLRSKRSQKDGLLTQLR